MRLIGLFSVLSLLFSCQKAPIKRFSALTSQTTGITFVNEVPDQTPDGMNIIQYLYYYNGGGVAAGDFDRDGQCDLFFTSNVGKNGLFRNKGNFEFEDVTSASGITKPPTQTWTTGVTVADVNADGWLDLYICQVGQYKKWSGANQLWINEGVQNGTLHFKEQATEYGLALRAFSTQAAFFDFDGDSDLDCFVACHSVHAAGSYRDTAQTRRYDPLAADRLYLNDNGHFTDVSASKGIYGGAAGYALGLSIGDFNGDHWPDIYVANDFHENDYFYQNEAGKGFKERITEALGHTSNFSMGCDLADINNDAAPDLITMDMKPAEETVLKASQPADPYDVYQFKHSLGYHWQIPRNTLQLNQSEGGNTDFQAIDIAQYAGVAATDWSWSALLADLDLDGWRDLYVTNGIVRRPNNMDYLKFISSAEVQRQATDLELIEKMPSGKRANYVFRNRSDLTFEDASMAWGLDFEGCSNGAVYADLDRDGDLDIVSNNINAPASIFRNETISAQSTKTPPANYLTIRLKGASLNPFAVGAKAWCYAGGQVQYAENMPVRGFQSCVEPGVLYFGMGKQAVADSIVVRWPDGKWTTTQAVAANQILLLDYLSAQTKRTQGATLPVAPILIQKTTWQPGGIPNQVPRFFQQKLQPWATDNTGPSITICDLDHDTNPDLFVQSILLGSAAWQSQLPVDQTIAASVVLDMDGDGDQDMCYGLASPSGSNATCLGFLRQDAGGSLQPLAPSGLPLIPDPIACIRAADYDLDGDVDLFVGTRAVTGHYGQIPRSVLLENDGKGSFSSRTLDPHPVGMVTDAQWADTNGDGRLDLIVCGEWMPLTIFRNTTQGFVREEIPHSAGFWNKICVADFDQDGDMDFVAGNMGFNSILQADPKEPLELWIGDFDANGTEDPILAYYRQGKKSVWADKDLITNQIPMLRKEFVQYQKYANSTFDAVITPQMQRAAVVRRVEKLASSFIENQGNGRWAMRDLPVAAQLGTVAAILAHDFDGDGVLDLLLGGNMYEVHPSIGRFDAQSGTMLRGIGQGKWEEVPRSKSGFRTKGAIRDIQFVEKGPMRGVLVVTQEGKLTHFSLAPTRTQQQ